jgi:hypothetical protein
VNPDCPRLIQAPVRLKARTKPVTAAVHHGYHAGVAAYGLLSDYDQPISSHRWQSAS